MIVVGGWPDRNVVGLNGRFGVRPADFATGGDFDNPFLNDVDPGDETTEFVGVVQTLPGSGTVVFDDLGGFEHTGAADGAYTTTFELYTWAQGGPITAHTPDEEITTTFGSTSTAPSATLTATASLVPGSASGTANATAAGVTLTAAASLLAGAASGTANATAAGVLLQVGTALLAGSASADGNATAPGQVLIAQASLLAGSASGVANAVAPGALLLASASLLPGSAIAWDGAIQIPPGYEVYPPQPRQLEIPPIYGAPAVLRFSDKAPGDRLPLSFNFSRDMDEVLVSPAPVVQIARAGGEDDHSPSAMLDGQPIVQGARVIQWVTGGVDGTRYALTCSARRADGAVFSIEGELAVR